MGKEMNIWNYFQGKENTDDVLLEKATFLSSALVGGVCGGTDSFINSLREKNEINVDKATLGTLILETTCLCIHLIDRVASEYLSSEKRNTFILSLCLEVIEGLKKELEITGGVQSAKLHALFERGYKERHEEYQKHDFGNISKEEAWGEKDGIYWYFGKQIENLLNLQFDLATDSNVQALYISALFPLGLTRDLLTLGSETKSEEAEPDEEIDFSKRILCSDGNCIGVINEHGMCKICGLPYRENKNDLSNEEKHKNNISNEEIPQDNLIENDRNNIKKNNWIKRIMKFALVVICFAFIAFVVIRLIDPSRYHQVFGDWGRRLGYNSFAVNHYSRAIHLNATNAGAFNSRGVSRYNQGKIDLAIDDYNRAIELDSQYALAFKNRALALLVQGKAEEAKRDYIMACNLGRCEDFRRLCSDLEKMCEEGDCKTLKVAVKAGLCL